VTEVSENSGQIDELPVFWRSAPGGDTPALYLHGVPTNSDDWVPFLQAGGGLAPDLPGFGRSGKPGNFVYTIEGYADFLERYLDLVQVDRVRLVVHDWGAVGLAFAQRHPGRVERLVIVNAVPFLPGYRWHRAARLWRRQLIGELVMGSTTKWVLRRASREANVTPGPLPESWVDTVWDHLDQGTQRAILRLYRSASPEVLERAGAALSSLTMPALVLWGEQDPYIPVSFAAAYGAALPDAEVRVVPEAGHWPWLDQPALVSQIVAFAGGE
jgi:pimeloyl-ACP methyl ester carboxylesterase